MNFILREEKNNEEISQLVHLYYHGLRTLSFSNTLIFFAETLNCMQIKHSKANVTLFLRASAPGLNSIHCCWNTYFNLSLKLIACSPTPRLIKV